MRHYLIAQRYAKALLLTLEDDALEYCAEMLTSLARLLDTDPVLGATLANPALPAARREAVLDEILRVGAADPVAARFVKLVFQRGRIGILGDIATVFREHVDIRRNRVTARVTTATPLGESRMEEIRAGIAAWTGKEVQIDADVDPEVIGGVVVYVDGTVIDGSLRARLAQLRTSLLS